MKKIDFINLSIDESLALFGVNDEFLHLVDDLFTTSISYRDNQLIIDDENKADIILKYYTLLLDKYKLKHHLDKRDFIYLADHIADSDNLSINHSLNTPFGKSNTGKLIYPKTKGQLIFTQAIKKYDVLFVIGPAGTGKTYLSVVYAANQLKENNYKKIIITRPAVEAGESLGFLPGDLKEKVDPYLQPLYDALNDTLGVDNTSRLIDKKIIEVIPLAYMRGRTLDDAIIILDEAQNTTNSQLKMFLTRLGINSKMIINGDITQIDLKNNQSGLVKGINILKNIKEIGFIELDSSDVVRHPIVQKIIEAYANES